MPDKTVQRECLLWLGWEAIPRGVFCCLLRGVEFILQGHRCKMIIYPWNIDPTAGPKFSWIFESSRFKAFARPALQLQSFIAWYLYWLFKSVDACTPLFQNLTTCLPPDPKSINVTLSPPPPLSLVTILDPYQPPGSFSNITSWKRGWCYCGGFALNILAVTNSIVVYA